MGAAPIWAKTPFLSTQCTLVALEGCWHIRKGCRGSPGPQCPLGPHVLINTWDWEVIHNEMLTEFSLSWVREGQEGRTGVSLLLLSINNLFIFQHSY